ncbi:MAG: DUF1330 domain-containing protein [Pseudomonadota bacterium]|nr:DUF1330 domain-containing protein [Pseudomonadota bacterium]
MTVYAIAQLTIHDRASYDRYQSRFFDVFSQFKGRLLAADENPDVVEGVWDRDKVVLMSFPDKQAFLDWAQSPAYKDISKDRTAGSSAVILLANGFEPGRARP